MYNIKFKFFVIMSIAQFRAKNMTLYLCAKLHKNDDLNSISMRIFVQNWFCIDTKLIRNFVHNKSFRAKTRNCCARESAVS